MSQYQVQSIEEDAKQTRKNLLAAQKKLKKEHMTVSVGNMIGYCDKVLFLCKTIRKLNHTK